MSEKTGEKKRHIFISHRMEDREIAIAIRDGLQGISDRILVHVCTKQQGEQDWRLSIEEAIDQSQILVFLYTMDREEAWQWCLYEIGLFTGIQHRDPARRWICIKNPDIQQLPSPIQYMEPYDATEGGIEQFVLDVVQNKKYFDESLADKANGVDRRRIDDAVDIIARNFKKSRIDFEYYHRKIDLRFSSGKGDEHLGDIDAMLAHADISGNSVTMSILFDLDEDNATITKPWTELYARLKQKGQQRWLDEIKDCVEKLTYGESCNKDLTPFRMPHGRRSYLPIISSVERLKIAGEAGVGTDGREKQYEARRISILFISQSIDRENLLETLPTLIPFSKVKIRIKGGIEDAQFALDEEGRPIPPIVIEMNDRCLRLFDLRRNAFDARSGEWTPAALLDRLANYMVDYEENRKKLEIDQGEVVSKILNGSYMVDARIPLLFNERHPSFKNQCFLPCVIAIQVLGEEAEDHEVILLVGYVKHFWLPDDEKNPFNIEHRQKRKKGQEGG